jgi:hypothetical protein
MTAGCPPGADGARQPWKRCCRHRNSSATPGALETMAAAPHGWRSTRHGAPDGPGVRTLDLLRAGQYLRDGAARAKKRRFAGLSKRLMGLEPTTFCMASSCRSAAADHVLPANRHLLLAGRGCVVVQIWPRFDGVLSTNRQPREDWPIARGLAVLVARSTVSDWSHGSAVHQGLRPKRPLPADHVGVGGGERRVPARAGSVTVVGDLRGWRHQTRYTLLLVVPLRSEGARRRLLLLPPRSRHRRRTREQLRRR